MDKERALRLLLLCSRLDPSPSHLSEIGRILEKGPAWDWVESQAAVEGTDSLLYWNLRFFPQAVSEGSLERLKIRYLRTVARNTRLFRLLEPLLDAAYLSGIRIALTKGARLAQTVYPDLGLRPFGDIDCMVHPRDWPALKGLLDDQGFREAAASPVGLDPSDPRLHWTYSPYFRKEELLVELHFSYLGLHFPFGSEDDLWASTRRLSVRGSEASVLSAEFELCYLCLHAQQHSFQKLMWLSDIAALAAVGPVDWDKVAAVCEREKIRSSVSYSLHLVDSLWPGAVPRRVLSRLAAGPIMRQTLSFLWPEKAVARREVSDAWPYYMPSVLSLWERKNPLAAFRALSSILFPPRSWMRHVTQVSGRPVHLSVLYLRRLTRPLGLAAKRVMGL